MRNCRLVWVDRETLSLKIILIVIVKKWWFWQHGVGLKVAQCSCKSRVRSCRGLEPISQDSHWVAHNHH